MPEAEISMAKLEDSARDIARLLDMRLQNNHGRRIGFALLLFEFGDGGNATYMSNGTRPDMIKAIKEWLARAEAT